MNHPRLLIVSPAFHGYWRSIQHAFERIGFTVSCVPYDALGSTSAKLAHKVLDELPAQMGLTTSHAERASTKHALEALRDSRPDQVLIIRGDGLGAAFWDQLAATGTPNTLWLYDELRRMRLPDERLETVDHLVSYSHHDIAELATRGVNAHFLANAFDPDLGFHPIPTDAVVFVGARHPNREAALTALHQAGIPVLAHGREWSTHWFDRLRTWEIRRPDIPTGRDIPLSQSLGLAAGALAGLNMHQNQDGFTMRTFEVPGVGGLQLIDRPDVEEFYDPGREVLTFTSHAELVDLVRRAQRDVGWAEAIRAAGRARTLAHHTFDHRARTLAHLWA